MYLKSILTIAAVAGGFLASPAKAATLTWSNADGLYWDDGAGTWGSVPVFDHTADVVMGGVTTTKSQSFMSKNGQLSPTLRSITFNALFGSGKTDIYNLKIKSRYGDPSEQTMTFAADSGNSTFTVDSGFGFDKIRVALGALALNNDLDVVQNDTDTELLFDLPVTGVGGINKSGAGLLTLDGAATFDGDIVVSAGTVTITNGITFKIGANGTNNQISGTGTVELEGAVSFNLADAGLTLNDSWMIIDDANLSSLTANITSIDVVDGASFTEDSPGVWNVDANGRRYQYTELNHTLIVTVAAAPMTSATRPFIWAKASERAALLDKISTNAWASSLADDLTARVAGELTAYESDPDDYLRELPVDWSHTPNPIFHTTEAEVRNSWKSKLNTALDCSVLYYLTGNSSYAALAGGVLHNSVESLLDTPTGPLPYGGWTFHDGGLLKEAREVGTQMPIIYDFLHGYLQSNTVWSVDAGSSVSFSTNNAQTVFETYWQLCRDRGLDGNNWGALMGTCMVLNILGLDDVADRDAALDFYTYTGTEQQDSLATDHSHFDQAAPHAIYPESLQYAGGVVTRDTYAMTLIERYDTNRTLFAEFSLIPESLHRLNDLKFPNGTDYIVFGDGPRETDGKIDYLSAELIYQHAKRLGRTDLMDFNGGLITEGLSSGDYDRSELDDYASLGKYNEPLKLLWSEPEINETPVALEVHRTDTVPFAGIALQRNLSPNDDPDYGLMAFVGGAGHVHSHPSGMNMELYGMGEVLGAKTYGKSDEARNFAAGNTVIVNGYSRGEGDWKDFAINTVQVAAMEPAARQAGVSSNISFTCSLFVDDKGTGAEADQQRTMAIIRTSPTTGYYVDLFRSDSSLGGEYHDYVYRNIGDSLSLEDDAGTPLSLSSAPNRFQNDTDEWNSPGWGFWTDTKVSATETNSVRARFTTQPTGVPEPIYMDLHIPGDSAREYATALAPAVDDISDPYDDLPIPALSIRKNGEAWDRPFAVVYEPHHGTTGSVQKVTALEQGGVVVGMKVESLVGSSNITQYVISNPGADEVYSDPSLGLSFTGRFAVVTDRADGSGELYIGEGSHLAYSNLSLTAWSGSLLFDANGIISITTNAPPPIPTYYLQADIPTNPNPGPEDRSWWWDAQVNGSLMPADAPFPGNHFDLNGYTFKSENTNGFGSFAGTILKNEAAGNILVYAQTYSMAGLNWSTTGGALKTRKDDMDLSITNLSVMNTMTVRVNSTEKNLDLHVATLTGNGDIRFGDHNTAGEDGDSIWGLDIDNSEFTGVIEINVGNLRFDDALFLPNATLSVVAGDQLTSVILSNNATFGAMRFDGTPVADDSYTAGQLNSLLGGSRFSGSGTLTVQGSIEAPSYSLWLADFPTLGTQTNFADDFEPDGLDNLLEYALGGNPTNNDAVAVLAASTEAGWLNLVYDRRTDAAARGLTYSVVTGTNLVDGSITNIVPDHGVSPATNGFETVTNRTSTAVDDHAFMKLEVELTE